MAPLLWRGREGLVVYWQERDEERSVRDNCVGGVQAGKGGESLGEELE